MQKTRSRDQVGGGKPGPGRPKGVANKATIEARTLCQTLLEDPAYWESFVRRLERGELPPALEAMVWHYAYGKPKESMEVAGNLAVTLKRVLAAHGDAAN